MKQFLWSIVLGSTVILSACGSEEAKSTSSSTDINHSDDKETKVEEKNPSLTMKNDDGKMYAHNTKTITIQGESENLQSLTINGKDVSIKADGHYLTEYDLRPGENTYELVGTGVDGEQITKSFTVKRETKEEMEKRIAKEKGNNISSLYEYMIPKMTKPQELQLTQKSIDFIAEKYKFFPAEGKEIQQVKNQTNNSIAHQHLAKNVQPYFDTFTTFSGRIVSINAATNEQFGEIAWIHIIDDRMNSYQVLYNHSTKNIFKDDYIRFWGVPVGKSGFENVGGGYTNVQVFAASHIEKR